MFKVITTQLNMSNDYFKAQGWFKNYALNSQDSRGMFQQLVKEDEEAFRLASAETDKIKAMINKKYGPGSMKYGSEIPQPSQRPDVIEIDAINAFMKRNPAAEGGRMKFEKGLKVEDLTKDELVNAQSAARKAGITSKKGSEEFANFVGGDTYKRASTIEAERAADLGIDLETYKKMSKKEKTKLYNAKYSKANKAKAGNVVGDTIEEIVVQLQNGGTFSKKQKEKKMLYDTYSKLFREEFDKLKELDEPFTKSDLTKRVITRVEELYTTKDGYFNEDFLPTRDLSEGSARSWYDFIEPSAKSDKKKRIFSDDELKLFSQKGTGLKRTKTQEKIFDLLADGVNEVDDIAKALGMPVGGNKTRITYEIEKMLTNMFARREQDVPVFLNEERKSKYSDVINSLESSNSLDGYYRRNIYSTIEETFKGDAEKIKLAKQKIREFNKFKKNLAIQFPGLEINYDHPASYRALKNQKLEKFMNITPIMKDINIFKSQFDLRSQLNLQAMEEARAAGNMNEYKRLLKNQRGIERLWSNLTGGQSTLGKVRLGKATNLGTTALLDESKDLVKEFEGNLKIRENIAKNIDPSVKFYDPISKTEKTLLETMGDLFPVTKGETRLIESAKKLTSPDLIDFDKKVRAYITDTTGKVKQPMLSAGFAGAFEQLMDEPAIKALKNSRGYKSLAKVASLPSKLFGAADILLGALDYENSMSKGYGHDLSLKNAIQATTFGLWKTGDKEYLKQLKNTYLKNGGDESVFDQVISLNTQNSEILDLVEKTKEQYQRESKNEKIYGTAGGPEAIKFQLSVPSASDTLKTNLSAIKTKAEKMDKDFTTFTETYKGTDLVKPSKDIKAAAFDLGTEQRIRGFKDQGDNVDIDSGDVWDNIKNSILTKDSYKKLLPQNLPSTLNQIIPFMDYKPVTEREKEKARIMDMKENYPREFYRYNIERGHDLDNPLSRGKVEEIYTKPELGFSVPKAEGGITTLRSQYEYKK